MAVVKSWFPVAISLSIGLIALVDTATSGASVNESATGVEDDSSKRTVAQLLASKLALLDSLQSNYEQRLLTPSGDTLEQSSGYLVLQKPRLKWQTLKPFPQTLVVADGELRIYDPDLMQMVIQPIAQDMNAPMQILLQPHRLTTPGFQVQKQPSNETGSNQHSVFTVSSPDSGTLYASIALTFSGDELIKLVIFDHEYQRTEINFLGMSPFAKDAGGPDPFILDLPVGTDVVRG